ncbi:MAG: hypothetical protein R2713_13700 [Ilumatobacteraceae bacterium]
MAARAAADEVGELAGTDRGDGVRRQRVEGDAVQVFVDADAAAVDEAQVTGGAHAVPGGHPCDGRDGDRRRRSSTAPPRPGGRRRPPDRHADDAAFRFVHEDVHRRARAGQAADAEGVTEGVAERTLEFATGHVPAQADELGVGGEREEQLVGSEPHDRHRRVGPAGRGLRLDGVERGGVGRPAHVATARDTVAGDELE